MSLQTETDPMVSRAPREKDLFTAALQLPADKRAAFLDSACAGDAALRASVDQLLWAHANGGSLLDYPASGAHAGSSTGAEVETQIHRYHLLQVLGEGGCGVVYLAEQEEPVRRRVALKVIKPGMDTRSVVARFRTEQQALALMDHPGIARVYDAGTTSKGLPYFVMELVRGGEAITTYCDRRHLDVVARVALFVQVCRAVDHAHRQGVIHRDLKPSNILVTDTTQGPRPKVIDFGVAKATRHADGEPLTRIEQLIGTPLYMSPEQALGNSDEMDVRSDVYSLGAVFYELLTGRLPFDRVTVDNGSMEELRRVLRDEEPVRPSARLTTLDDADRAAIAGTRNLAPGRLSTSLRGDIDAVVMKALEKDRSRRYGSAEAMAEDLERYLRNEPVQARRAWGWRAVHRLARRHRQAVLALAGISLLLAIVALFDTAAVVKAAVLLLAGAAAAAVVVASRTSLQRQRLERVVAVFRDVLEGLGRTSSLHPVSGLDRDGAHWRRVLQLTTERLTIHRGAHPEVEAEVCHVLAKIHLAMNQQAEAEGMLRRVLELRRGRRCPPLQLAQACSDLGLTLAMQRRGPEAERVLREAAAIRRRALGRQHPVTLRSLEDLGFVLWVTGRHLEAERVLREELALRAGVASDAQEERDHPEHWPLAICLSFLEVFEEAERLARACVDAVCRRYSEQHPFHVRATELLADCLTRQGRFDEALPWWQASLEVERKRLPSDHPALVHPTWGVAFCLHQLGRFELAEPLYEESLRLWRGRMPKADREVMLRLDWLAMLRMERGDDRAAEPLLDEAWRLLHVPDNAAWLDFWPEVIWCHIELWSRRRRRSNDARMLQRWTERLATFEAETLARSPGPDRVNALRGLTATYRLWARTDPAKKTELERWRGLLRAERDAFLRTPGPAGA